MQIQLYVGMGREHRTRVSTSKFGKQKLAWTIVTRIEPQKCQETLSLSFGVDTTRKSLCVPMGSLVVFSDKAAQLARAHTRCPNVDGLVYPVRLIPARRWSSATNARGYLAGNADH